MRTCGMQITGEGPKNKYSRALPVFSFVLLISLLVERLGQIEYVGIVIIHDHSV